MARSKPAKPSCVAHDDHELITPDIRRLRRTVRQAKPEEPDPVACAEQALARISSEFATWTAAECARLDAARRKVKRQGLSPTTRSEIFLAAHDVKGDAGAFGYPEVIPAADSLCRLLEHSPDLGKIPIKIIDQHVDAVRAIVREHGRTDNAAVAASLTRKLRAVTDEYLVRENANRPEVLKAIQSPPLAPSETF